MKSLNVRGVDDEVMVEFKLAAAKSGKRLRDWVLDSLCEVVNQEVGNGSGEIRQITKSPDVYGVRGGVRDGQRREGVAKVQRPSDDPPANRGAVDESAQDDPVREGTSKDWLGPKHAASCKCMKCRLEKR